jgi:hypothetical protein
MEGRAREGRPFSLRSVRQRLGRPFHRWDSKAGLNSILAGDSIPLSGIVGPTHWQRTSAI